jgi:hypothetical protein
MQLLLSEQQSLAVAVLAKLMAIQTVHFLHQIEFAERCASIDHSDHLD